MEETLQIVSYEQGKRLRQLGYDWKCRPYYDENGNIAYQDVNNDLRDGCCYAPTTALALKWLRDKRHVLCAVNLEGHEYFWSYDMNTIDLPCIDDMGHCTYEEAESALLDAVLTELEKGDTNYQGRKN